MSFSLELFNLLKERLNGFASFNFCRESFQLSGKQLQLLHRQAVPCIHNTTGSSPDLGNKKSFLSMGFSSMVDSTLCKNCPVWSAVKISARSWL